MKKLAVILAMFTMSAWASDIVLMTLSPTNATSSYYTNSPGVFVYTPGLTNVTYAWWETDAVIAVSVSAGAYIDDSGYQTFVTNIGGVTIVTNSGVPALLINGANKSVEFTGTSLASASHTEWLSFWVYLVGTPGDNESIMTFGTAASYRSLLAYIRNWGTGPDLTAATRGSGGDIDSGHNVPAGAWHHCILQLRLNGAMSPIDFWMDGTNTASTLVLANGPTGDMPIWIGDVDSLWCTNEYINYVQCGNATMVTARAAAIYSNGLSLHLGTP